MDRQHGLDAVAQGLVVRAGGQVHPLALRSGDGAYQRSGRLRRQLAGQLGLEVLPAPQDPDRAVSHVHDIVRCAVADVLLRVPLPRRGVGDRCAGQIVADNLHGVSPAPTVPPVRRNQGGLHLLGDLGALGQSAEALRLSRRPVGRQGRGDAVGVQRGLKAGIGPGHRRAALRHGLRAGEPELLPAPSGEESQHVNARGLADQQAACGRCRRHSRHTGGKPASPGPACGGEHLPFGLLPPGGTVSPDQIPVLPAEGPQRLLRVKLGCLRLQVLHGSQAALHNRGVKRFLLHLIQIVGEGLEPLLRLHVVPPMFRHPCSPPPYRP